MKTIVAALFLLLIVQGAFAQDSDSMVLLEQVQKSVKTMKDKPLDLDKALRQSVKHYDKSLDRKFLTKLLSQYSTILKSNQQHYVVEMFWGLYKKDKKKFGEYLDKALSQKDKADFLERMKIVAREEQGGNG